MNIVIGVHHYPPTYMAGVELVGERLARWLVGRGHTVEVVCIEDIDTDGPITVRTDVQDGVIVRRLGLKLTGGELPLSVRHRDDALAAWFSDYLRTFQPDVFHSLSSYLLSASLIDAAKALDVAVVAGLHDYWYICPRTTLLRSDGQRCDAKVTAADCARCLLGERRRYRALEAVRIGVSRWTGGPGPLTEWMHRPELVAALEDRRVHLHAVLESVDQIVTPALLTRELLLERKFSPDQVKLVRHGIRAAPDSVKQVVRPDNRLRVAFLGQLAPHKGVHVLLEAVRGLAVGRRLVEVRVHGDPTRSPAYVADLRKSAARLPHVQFCGSYKNDQVWEVLRDVDVIVVPSLWFEISPLVILEAFAAGVPVIASDLRNMNYQVNDDVDGLLFKPGDANDLRRQLQRLIDDPDLLPQLRRGISPVHELEKEMREIEGIYQAVMARGQAAKDSPSLAGA